MTLPAAPPRGSTAGAAPRAPVAHPRPLDLRSPLRALSGVGPRTAEALAGAGLETVGDLLAHLPRDYEDRRAVTRVADARPGAPLQLRGELEGVRARRAGRRVLVEATLRDGSGAVGVTWFGQPWLADRLRGAGTVSLHGSLRAVGRRLVLSHPEWSPAAAGEEGIVPVYPELAGIGSARLRGWIAEALERLDLERSLGEPVPAELLARHALPRLADAVRALHRPAPDAAPAALAAWESPAHARLVYGELLAQQRVLAARAAAARRAAKAHRYRIDDAVRARAREVLPFALTAAQKRALRELAAELAAPPPMRRLLQGDVGSGKTVVAALLLLLAAESGLQGALLAPTELLAEQHHAALSRLLGAHHPVLLLAGGRGSDAERRALRRGQVKLVVGTQALIQEGVAFQHLALVVIDEQHRFGVRQRRLLEEKGYRPDLLVMSATPIPRSLALAAYGDLDLTVLDELPPGRRPVATALLPARRREAAMGRLRRELDEGGQAYVVFPAIGAPGDAADEPSLHGLGERWRAALGEGGAGHRCAVLHGSLPASERSAVMDAFRRGETRLLLATTVIEVGVDVPAATAMVIEGAERFGLAGLHQLRGRVGRGERPAWCLALHGPASELAKGRLAAFAALADGFALAEEDLRLRGPGELLGERQAGMPELRFAALPRDHAWLVRAWQDARELQGRAPRGGEPDGGSAAPPWPRPVARPVEEGA